MSTYLRFTIPGEPLTKKNHRPIFQNRRTGRAMIGKSAGLRDSEEAAYYELLGQKNRQGVETITTKVSIKFVFYCSTKRARDLSNLYELPQDALQKAGIIANDHLVESHDGSRKRIDPDNPRTEITITDFVE